MSALIAAVVVLTNLAYTAGFDTLTRCPSWVQYDLEPGEVVVTNRVPFQFRPDSRVAESDNGVDYAGSGYDRGHMAPAADFNFDRAALGETYLYSNVCPQMPEINRGAWAEIEREVRQLAASGTVHVVTWPEYMDGICGTNMMGRVRVPAAFRKVAWGWFGVRTWVVLNFDLACAKEKPKTKNGENQK